MKPITEIRHKYYISWHDIRKYLKLEEKWDNDYWSYRMNNAYLIKRVGHMEYYNPLILITTNNNEQHFIEYKQIQKWFDIKFEIVNLGTVGLDTIDGADIVITTNNDVIE